MLGVEEQCRPSFSGRLLRISYRTIGRPGHATDEVSALASVRSRSPLKYVSRKIFPAPFPLTESVLTTTVFSKPDQNPSKRCPCLVAFHVSRGAILESVCCLALGPTTVPVWQRDPRSPAGPVVYQSVRAGSGDFHPCLGTWGLLGLFPSPVEHELWWRLVPLIFLSLGAQVECLLF